MFNLSPAEQAELNILQRRCTEYLSGEPSRADSKRVDILLSKIASIKETGLTETEAAHSAMFRSFMSGRDYEAEFRGNDFLAGHQAISFTDGSEGGFLVPQQFSKNVAEGLAAVDPLLDPNVASVIVENDFKLRPLQLPGWDLSTIAAVQVDEGD